MISVLFATKNSVYKTIPGLDVWDEDRNALNWPGKNRGIFHPPCRKWSRWLRHFSTAPESEKHLAIWAVHQVRKWGGVLEHPACSTLFDHMTLPRPGRRDEYGLTICVEQFWFGHKCRKASWLYICGVESIPPIPLVLGEAPVQWDPKPNQKAKHPDMQRLSNHDRQATPLAFAYWLIDLCNQTVMNGEPAK